MNVINSNDVIYSSKSQVNSASNTPNSSGFSGSDLLQGDSVFSGGLMTLYMFMQMLSDQANGKYSGMDEASNKSRSAQEYATAVDKLIADIAASGDKGKTIEIPQEVKDYIEANHLEVPGVYDGKTWTKDPDKANSADLNAIKGTLENVANRASDFVSSSQLQLQKIMQTYNVSVSLINSLQTMLTDMNKTIAQGIR